MLVSNRGEIHQILEGEKDPSLVFFFVLPMLMVVVVVVVASFLLAFVCWIELS